MDDEHEAWQAFTQEYNQELQDVEQSRTAKRFAKQAREIDRANATSLGKVGGADGKGASSVKDDNATKGNNGTGARSESSHSSEPLHSSGIGETSSKQRSVSVDKILADGTQDPRNYRSSWLDTDRVMDDWGEDFVPPNPRINLKDKTLVTLWVLFALGVVGIIVSVVIPSFTGWISSIAGVCLLISSAGLLMRRGNAHHGDGIQV